jgi:plasmid stabilization system protein ParE
MAREVVWTDPAWEDLEAAAEFIARDSEAYAAAFVQEMKAAATSLSEMAERGQIVPEMVTLRCAISFLIARVSSPHHRWTLTRERSNFRFQATAARFARCGA